MENKDKNPSYRQVRLRTLRRYAKRKQKRVIDKYGSNCYICGRKLVSLQELTRYGVTIIEYNTKHIYYKDVDGNILKGTTLTIDHIKQLKEYTDEELINKNVNHIDNLRPSCFNCNNKRNKNGITTPKSEEVLPTERDDEENCIC